jgi:hypothetical protein
MPWLDTQGRPGQRHLGGAKYSDMPNTPVRTTKTGVPESPLVKMCSTEPIFFPLTSTTIRCHR